MSAISFAALRDSDGVPAALISGSTMVQVALGEVWKNSDVDVFCTKEAVESVRTQLGEVGFVPPGEEYEGQFEMEEYEANMNKSRAPKMFDSGIESVEHLEISGEPRTHFTSSGFSASDLKGGVDIVIGKAGCTDARQLLESFDILICAVSFDGFRFHIPHPHLTFMRKSLLERKRLLLMDGLAVAMCLQCPSFSYLGDFFQSHFWDHAVRSAISRCAAGEPDANLSPIIPFLSDRRYFEFFLRLFKRQQKYAGRGIELIGSPVQCHKIEYALSYLNSLPWERIYFEPSHGYRGRHGDYE